MEILFISLPVLQSFGSVVSGDVSSVEEWSEAVRCLGKAPQSWLLDFLKVYYNCWDREVEAFVEVDPTGRFGLAYNDLLGCGAFKKVYMTFDEDHGLELALNQVCLRIFKTLFKSTGLIMRLSCSKHSATYISLCVTDTEK